MKRSEKTKLNLIQAARSCAQRSHAGQRFKYCIGPYIKHPEAVSERGWTEEEKALGFLHDVVEDLVAKQLKANPGLNETSLVRAELRKIEDFFKRHSNNAVYLTDDIDILTKRSTDKGDAGYRAYIERIIAYAKKTGRTSVIVVKMADLDDNSRADRNPPITDRKQKDIDRLARYGWAHARLRDAFPDVAPRPPLEEKPNPRRRPGRPPPDRRRSRAERMGWAHDAD